MSKLKYEVTYRINTDQGANTVTVLIEKNDIEAVLREIKFIEQRYSIMSIQRMDK